ncbi:hypothetical protein EYS14_00160 [Alteromonadaceae bacterium M269]|nr:hypothetical protein EYS14_00160 [Alteromonadaceae bacterium M269]
MVFFCGLVAARADETPTLEALLDSDLLKAALSDETLTKHEKLITRRCYTIEKHLKPSDTPTSQAVQYSCTAPVVGVAFYAGDDLGEHNPDKIAAYIKNEFDKYGVMARVFIKYDHEYGSSIAYLMSGGRKVMHKPNIIDGIKGIETFVAEMKLIFFKDKKISPQQLKEWVVATKAHIPEIG